MIKKDKKDHSDYSLNRMDNYFFNHHIFLLVELSYLRGNQSFYCVPFIRKTDSLKILFLNPIKDGPFWGWSRIGGTSLPKICHTYPTMVKRGRVTPYLKKNQKYRNIVRHPLYSADTSIFSPEIRKFSHIKKYRFRLHFNT